MILLILIIVCACLTILEEHGETFLWNCCFNEGFMKFNDLKTCNATLSPCYSQDFCFVRIPFFESDECSPPLVIAFSNENFAMFFFLMLVEGKHISGSKTSKGL